MNVLVVGMNFFYQPLEGEVVEHQHLELMPPFGHERHEYIYFLLSHLYHPFVAHLMKRWINHLYIIFIIFGLDVSNRNVFHDIPQWFITYIIKILICSLGAVRFIKFHIICFFNQAGGMIKYLICFGL